VTRFLELTKRGIKVAGSGRDDNDDEEEAEGDEVDDRVREDRCGFSAEVGDAMKGEEMRRIGEMGEPKGAEWEC
jgi:hypothetical protein